MLGFEFGYIELLDVETTNVEQLGEDSLIAGFGVATAVIVVAPVAEEIFFRAFFYRSLRTRLSVWPAADLRSSTALLQLPQQSPARPASGFAHGCCAIDTINTVPLPSQR